MTSHLPQTTLDLLDRCKRLLGERGLLDQSHTARFDVGPVDPDVIANMSGPEIASHVDHTLLKAEAGPEAIEKLCAEAAQYHFAAVCVNPAHIARCVKALEGTHVKIATVCGFPLGANTTETKAFEAREACELGADEIDMVLAIGRLKAGDYEYVHRDVTAVVRAARKAAIKVIIETCLLTDEEKILASLICRDAGAAFVKTSTGFNKSGATPEDVALMRAAAGTSVGIKAAGGIRDAESARAMLAAGANRLGCSAGVAIATGGKSKAAY